MSNTTTTCTYLGYATKVNGSRMQAITTCNAHLFFGPPQTQTDDLDDEAFLAALMAIPLEDAPEAIQIREWPIDFETAFAHWQPIY